MNERIRELLDQAGLKPEMMLDDSSRKVECFVTKYDGSVPSIENYIKLSELIVNECAQSLWTEECYNSDLALEEFEKNSKKIKDHFGVEE